MAYLVIGVFLGLLCIFTYTIKDVVSHIDSIAEALNIAIKFKSWKEKTVATKVKAILSKIEQLKKGGSDG